MKEEIQRFSQEQAAQMIDDAGEQPVRYIHGSADVYRQILKENPEAVDIRVSVAQNEDGKAIALVQAYDGGGKPIGEALNNPLRCPPFC